MWFLCRSTGSMTGGPLAARPRAAHFLLLPELVGSPPNEAITTALQELGYLVDLYCPRPERAAGMCGPEVRVYPVEYGKRWIMKNAPLPRWRQYGVFSGTCEDPMAVVGILGALHRRPCVTLADEIKSDAYRGNRPESWKRLCRWGMRRSRFTIVNDAARIDLQREYAGLSDEHEIIVYPGCFRQTPKPGDRARLRAARGIPTDGLVLAYSGTFGYLLGAKWMLAALDAHKELHVMAQCGDLEPLTGLLLRRTRCGERLHVEAGYLSWNEAWVSMAAADIGMVVYHHRGRQFQSMGTSSNRLCMYLAMGLPVIASRQRSFQFLEKYDCGVLVDTEEEFVAAIDVVRRRLPEMRANALTCSQEHVDSAGKYELLRATLDRLLGVEIGRA